MAQREAAEAYVISQREQGWTVVRACYDDGGFSGGTIDRPALRRLLDDIEAGLIDCVVVYKVDRLSRSLLDFARLMSVFDKAGVSFVSVTQQFNTTIPLGRLTLNILLSFAQFERDIIGERTRDKLRASRRKGQWTGGHVPLGYDLDAGTHRLVVNEPEAERVRAIFLLYAQQRSLAATVVELNRRGWQTKAWTNRKAQVRAARPFTWSGLRLLLTNVLYTGRVRHGKELVAGQQPALVDAEVFERVGAMLAREAAAQARRASALSGLLVCESCRGLMKLGRSPRGERRYVCGCNAQHTPQACDGTPLPATRIEAAVIECVRGLSRSANPAISMADVLRFVERIGYNPVTGGVSITVAALSSSELRPCTPEQCTK
jgi:site-specific DNA recombinase